MRVANGEILEIATDPRFEINGVTLYPMIIKFKNCLCPSYMHLLRKCTDNSKWSPYLFTSKNRRNKIVDYLTNFYTIIRVNATSTIPYFQIMVRVRVRVSRGVPGEDRPHPAPVQILRTCART